MSENETGGLLAGAPQGNEFEYSVAELAAALKRTLEGAFGFVRVRGEISGLSRPGSGHVYMTLRDADACIDAVIWKGTAAKLKAQPADGIEVVCYGRVTTFPARSKYQLVIERMELAGAGALLAMLEQRRKALEAEGLFAAARKKPIPWLPEVIGVITSPTGAVIRDILHRLEDRFPRRVIVWPVLVQGEQAAAQVAAAIRGFNALPADGPIPRPDVLIVARGGGAMEDLLPFSEEIVVRAAAGSAIPLISAVGHETDTTLIDHAADRRAPTPTAAAEMAVPVRAELVTALRERDLRLLQGLRRLEQERRLRLAAAARALPKPADMIAFSTQRLDAADQRLRAALIALVRRHDTRLARAGALLTPVRLSHGLARGGERITALADRLERAFDRRETERRQGLARAARLLEVVSYRATLARGFALVRDAAGHVVRSAAAVVPGTALTVQFSDGDAVLRADGAPQKPARKPTPGRDQGTLF